MVLGFLPRAFSQGDIRAPRVPNAPMPLRAAVVHRSCGNGAELLDHDGHDGTAALAGPPPPSPARRCPLLALRGSHIACDGHCGWLQAADRSRSRCRLPPCRAACRRSSIKSCRWSVGSCHRRSDKAALSLLAAAHEQRPRATLPFAMTPPHAAQRLPLPPFTIMRAHSELMNISFGRRAHRAPGEMPMPCAEPLTRQLRPHDKVQAAGPRLRTPPRAVPSMPSLGIKPHARPRRLQSQMHRLLARQPRRRR